MPCIWPLDEINGTEFLDAFSFCLWLQSVGVGYGNIGGVAYGNVGGPSIITIQPQSVAVGKIVTPNSLQQGCM